MNSSVIGTIIAIIGTAIIAGYFAIPATPPVSVIQISAGPYSSDIDISFNGELSTDANGHVKEYLWKFGDGEEGQGKNILHGYSDDGIYTISLTVIDNDGLSHSQTKEIRIGEEPSTPSLLKAVITGQNLVQPDVMITFTADRSKTPDDSFIEIYQWFVDDEKITEQSFLEYTFENEGTYQIDLIILDNYKQQSKDTISVTVSKQPGNIPPEIDTLLNEGEFYFNSKQYEEALKVYDEIISIDPSLTKAWHERGYTLMNIAIDEGYKKYPAEEPQANYEETQRKFEEALDSFDQEMELNPENPSTFTARGYVLTKLGNYQEGQEHPEDVQKSFEEALDNFDNAIKINSKYHEGWYLRGMVLYEMERWDEGKASFNTALKLEPEIYKNRYPFN